MFSRVAALPYDACINTQLRIPHPLRRPQVRPHGLMELAKHLPQRKRKSEIKVYHSSIKFARWKIEIFLVWSPSEDAKPLRSSAAITVRLGLGIAHLLENGKKIAFDPLCRGTSPAARR